MRLWVVGGLSLVILGGLILAVLVGIQGKLESQSLSAEVRSIRRLAVEGHWAALAERLDRTMVLVPAGEFILGSDTGRTDERPSRQIVLDAYQIDRFEVTNVQFWRYIQATGEEPPRSWPAAQLPAGQADHPVAGVSWVDAQAYCAWAGKRLPTEAEWEKACRGTAGALFPWGDLWDPRRANLGLQQSGNWPDAIEDGWLLIQKAGLDSQFPAPQPVGSFPGGVSPYGAADMVGNVSEWVADWYNWDGYDEWPSRKPVGLGPPWNHSVRGSSWFDRRGQAEQAEMLSRCPARNSSHSADDPRLGFRCARPVP
jgi:formylglycine-generating enzyme required for sulfatase activity